MTTARAKTLTADFLATHGVSFTKLTAKTVSFADLARGGAVFVTVHGWTPNSAADAVTAFARAQGFRVQFKGSGFVS